MAHRIMVADDNDLLRSIIADILQDAGYSVVEARTGKEALWHLDSYSDFSLLISDLAMPDISMDLGRSLGRILFGQAADECPNFSSSFRSASRVLSTTICCRKARISRAVSLRLRKKARTEVKRARINSQFVARVTSSSKINYPESQVAD
jgi:DNA-binding NarL/FixJ family response regulator